MRSGIGIIASHYTATAAPVDVLSEPFNNYLTNWAVVSGSPVYVDGRTGAGIQQSGSSANAIRYTIPGANESDYLMFGVAFKSTLIPANVEMIELRSDTGGTLHNVILVGASGAVSVLRSATTLVSSATGLVAANTWYYLEVQIRLHDTLGSVIVRLDGTEIINSTGLDTKNGGTKTGYDQVRLTAGVASALPVYDDFYLTMGDGATFKGVQAIGPDYAAINTTATEFGASMGAQAISAPSGVVAGDLLLAFVSHDNSGTALTASTGWTTIREGANVAVVRIGVFGRIADGGANDALTVTGSANDYCASMLCVKGHGVASVSTDVKSAIANSASGNADPPSLNAGSSADWLWIAAAAVDFTTGNTITAMPSGYVAAHAALVSASSTSSCGLATAWKPATATTEDPGAFANPTQEWAAVTLAIPKLVAPPAPTGVNGTPGNTQVALTWVAPAGPVTDYVVQYAVDSGTPTWNTFSEATSTATAATVTGLTNGTAYIFRVAAVNGAGTGSYSSASSAVTPTDAVPLALVQGAFGGGTYLQAGSPPEQRNLDLPDWAVTAGELLVVGLGTCKSTSFADPYWSLSGGGLTWTLQAKTYNPTNYHPEVAIFTAIATSTTTITDMTGIPNTKNLGVNYSFAKVTGYNVASPVGATAALGDSSTDGQKDITLSGTPAGTSIVYAVAFENSDDSATPKSIDHGASLGWTEAFDNGFAMTGSQIFGCWQGQYKTSPSTTTVRWDDLHPAAQSGSTYSFAGCAIEIKAA